MMKRPPKDLGQALKAGYQPMFMTGGEVKKHFAPYKQDRQYKPGGVKETDQELWDRKLTESKQTGEQRYGKDAFERDSRGAWRSLSGPDLVRRGIGAKTSLESVAQSKGMPGGALHLQDNNLGSPSGKPQVLGGHHRVALSAAQFPEHLFPIKYAPHIDAARSEPGYR
jgi:hypothetical protein